MSSPTLWAFGGGKGGVGKSLVCAAVAAEIARRGRRVVVLDADLGAANLHTLLGLLHPPRTLGDFFADRSADLEPFCVPTDVDGLRLVSGAAAILRAAHPRPADRRRLVEGILGLDADVLLIDLGAGTHYNTLDFFNLAGHRLLVTSPEPTSIQNAYAFVKAAIFRRLELGLARHDWVQRILDRAIQPRGDDRIDSMAHLMTVIERRDAAVAEEARSLVAEMEPRLVVNMADARAERRVSAALAVVCQRYLDLRPEDAGWLPDDPAARRAVRRMRPVLQEAPDGPLAGAVRALVGRIESREPRPRPDLLIEPGAAPARRLALVSPPSDAGDTVPAMAPYPGIRLSPPGTDERSNMRSIPSPLDESAVDDGSASGSTAGSSSQAKAGRQPPQTLARLDAMVDEPAPFGFDDGDDEPPEPTPFDFVDASVASVDEASVDRSPMARAASAPREVPGPPTYVASPPVSKSMFDDRLESVGALQSVEMEVLDPPLRPIDDPLDDNPDAHALADRPALDRAPVGLLGAAGAVGGLSLGRPPATGEAWDALAEPAPALGFEELEPVGPLDEVDGELDVSMSVFDELDAEPELAPELAEPASASSADDLIWDALDDLSEPGGLDSAGPLAGFDSLNDPDVPGAGVGDSPAAPADSLAGVDGQASWPSFDEAGGIEGFDFEDSAADGPIIDGRAYEAAPEEPAPSVDGSPSSSGAAFPPGALDELEGLDGLDELGALGGSDPSDDSGPLDDLPVADRPDDADDLDGLDSLGAWDELDDLGGLGGLGEADAPTPNPVGSDGRDGSEASSAADGDGRSVGIDSLDGLDGFGELGDLEGLDDLDDLDDLGLDDLDDLGLDDLDDLEQDGLDDLDGLDGLDDLEQDGLDDLDGPSGLDDLEQDGLDDLDGPSGLDDLNDLDDLADLGAAASLGADSLGGLGDLDEFDDFGSLDAPSAIADMDSGDDFGGADGSGMGSLDDLADFDSLGALGAIGASDASAQLEPASPPDGRAQLDGLAALGAVLDAQPGGSAAAFDVSDLDALPEQPSRPSPPQAAMSEAVPDAAREARPAPAPPSNIREALGHAGVRGVDPQASELPRAPSARWTGERLPGFTRDMLDALAVTDDESSAPAADPWQDEPWDDDPWGETRLAERPEGDRPERPATVEAKRAPTNEPLSDPPGHPVLGFAEALETPDGRLHLQTLDQAPATACVVQTVYRDGAVIARHRSAYHRLLDGEPEAIARHVEQTHERARAALLQGGLSRLGWAEPPRRTAGWGVG